MNPETRSPRDRLTRLLIACPHHLIVDPNPIECPLYDRRTRPLAERMAWARTVERKVVDRLLCHHDLCLARKRVDELEEYEVKTEEACV